MLGNGAEQHTGRLARRWKKRDAFAVSVCVFVGVCTGTEIAYRATSVVKTTLSEVFSLLR